MLACIIIAMMPNLKYLHPDKIVKQELTRLRAQTPYEPVLIHVPTSVAASHGPDMLMNENVSND